jgi:membrane protease YdiL (CAAX protease family)
MEKINPIIQFTIITFLISWLLWVPLLIWSQGNPDFFTSTSEIPPLLIVIQTLGAAAPSIAAIFTIRTRYGKETLENVFKKYFEWKQPLVFILVSILLLPLIHIPTLFLVYIFEGAIIWQYEATPIGDIVTSSGWIALAFTIPIVFVTNLLSSPLLEELGWRGFLLPKLQEKYSALNSSLIVGVIWGVWHIPLWLIYGDNLVLTLVMIILTSIIYTWLFNSTNGSMLMVLFFHSSANLALNLINVPSHIGTDDFASLPFYQLSLLLLVVVVLVATVGRKSLSRKSKYHFKQNLGFYRDSKERPQLKVILS